MGQGQRSLAVESEQSKSALVATVSVKTIKGHAGPADTARSVGGRYGTGELHSCQLTGHYGVIAFQEQPAQRLMVRFVSEIGPDHRAGVSAEQAHRVARAANSAALAACPRPRVSANVSSCVGTCWGRWGTTSCPATRARA